MARSYCSPRHTISASFSRRPSVSMLGTTAAEAIMRAATRNTTMSRGNPASFRRLTDCICFAESIKLSLPLPRRGGLFQRQRRAASRRNFFHIGGRIRQAHNAKPSQQSVPFPGNDYVLVVRRRKECPPVIPAKIADVSKIFGIHGERGRSRGYDGSHVDRYLRGWRRGRRRKRGAKNAGGDSLEFEGQK